MVQVTQIRQEQSHAQHIVGNKHQRNFVKVLLPLSLPRDMWIYPTVKDSAGFVDVEQSEELESRV